MVKCCQLTPSHLKWPIHVRNQEAPPGRSFDKTNEHSRGRFSERNQSFFFLLLQLIRLAFKSWSWLAPSPGGTRVVTRSFGALYLATHNFLHIFTFHVTSGLELLSFCVNQWILWLLISLMKAMSQKMTRFHYFFYVYLSSQSRVPSISIRTEDLGLPSPPRPLLTTCV